MSPLRRSSAAAVPVLLAVGVQSAANFALHAGVSRYLGPAAYGALATTLNLMLLLTVPLTALQLVATKVVAAAEELGEPPGRALRRDTLRLAAAASVLTALLALPLHLALALPSWWYVASLVPYVGIAVVSVVLRGVAVAQSRFSTLAGGIVLSALARLLLATAAVAYWGAGGALIATLLGELLLCLILRPRSRVTPPPAAPEIARALRDVVPSTTPEAQPRMRISALWRSSSALVGLWLFGAVDTLLCVRFLEPAEAGLYLAAATLARAIVILPQTVAAVEVPRMALSGPRAEQLSRGALRQAVLLGGGLGTFAAGVFAAAPTFVLALLYSRQYAAAAAVLGPLAVAAACVGIITICVYYLDARGRRAAHLPWVGVVIELGALWATRGSLQGMAWASLAASLVLLLVMLWVCFAELPRRLQRPALHGDPDLPAALAAAGLAPLGAPLIAPDGTPSNPQVLASLPDAPAPLWRDPEPDVLLSVVMPAFNAGSALVTTTSNLVSALEVADVSFEVLVVDDASRDDSVAELRAWLERGALEDHPRPEEEHRVRILSHPENAGKGAALRTGMEQARGAYVGFLDADGDIDPLHLVAYLDMLRRFNADIVTASKAHPLSVNHSSVLRRVLSGVFRTTVRILFHLPSRDTQTGAKVFRREVVADSLGSMVENRYAFDLELFVVATRRGYRRVLEAPVTIEPRVGSTLTRAEMARALRDVTTIFARSVTGGYGDRTAPRGAAPELRRADLAAATSAEPRLRPRAGAPTAEGGRE